MEPPYGASCSTEPGHVPYDILVLATGATHSVLRSRGVGPLAPGLKRIEEATRLRRRILLAFERAELAHDEAERIGCLTFTWLAAARPAWRWPGHRGDRARPLARDFRRIDPRAARIVLLEAGLRVLPTLPPDLAEYADEDADQHGCPGQDVDSGDRLRSAAASTRSGTHRCEHCRVAAGETSVPARDGFVPNPTVPGASSSIPISSIPGEPKIFAIGDTASVSDAA